MVYRIIAKCPKWWSKWPCSPFSLDKEGKGRSNTRKPRPCAERKNPVVAILIGCYLVATLTHLYLLFTGRPSGVVYGVGALLVGFALHTLMLGVSFASATPEGWGPWLSGMAWIIILMYLIVYARYRDVALGGFAVPRRSFSRDTQPLSPACGARARSPCRAISSRATRCWRF